MTLKVKNTGNLKGSEAVQLYITDLKSSVERPVKELKAFQKVNLNPGEEKLIKFTIDQKTLSFFDVETHDWKVEPGDFELLVGNSSQNIKLQDKFV